MLTTFLLVAEGFGGSMEVLAIEKWSVVKGLLRISG